MSEWVIERLRFDELANHQTPQSLNGQVGATPAYQQGSCKDSGRTHQSGVTAQGFHTKARASSKACIDLRQAPICHLSPVC